MNPATIWGSTSLPRILPNHLICASVIPFMKKDILFYVFKALFDPMIDFPNTHTSVLVRTTFFVISILGDKER